MLSCHARLFGALLRFLLCVPCSTIDLMSLLDAVETKVRQSQPVPVVERDPDQWWFWTPEWQAGEREVDRQRAAGQTTICYSADEMDAQLEAAAQRIGK